MNQIKNATNSIILYGAGENAEQNLSKWILEGLEPMCFADFDTKKHYTVLGGIEILPLDEAISRYPDYTLCITTLPGNLLAIRNYLLEKGIPAEKITTIVPYEYRKGCNKLGKHMFFYSPYIITCCAYKYSQKIDSSGVVESDFLAYHQYSEKMLQSWRENTPTPCDGCPMLKYDYYELNPQLNAVSIGTSEGDICNFRCSFCNQRGVLQIANKAKHTMRMRYEYIMAILHYVRDNILPDNPNFQIHYSSGEPTITPYFDEIVDFWYENKINVVLYSNWSVYNQKFTNLSRDFGAKLYASLDAGTAKTFAQIKGVDCFDKVVDNLIRFSENGGHVRLKYMLLEDINDNKKEIMAFFAIAKRMKSPKIQLCSLFEKSLESAKPKTLEMLYLFLEECYVQGFSIPLLDLLHFTHFDKNNLDKRINELWGKQ